MSTEGAIPSVVVGQCLFGYDRGHRLLATSERLAPATARTLLLASDFEVAAVQSTAWGELTGFPLDDAGLYAFSASWPAPEMPRPGCVWTHTVLVPFPVLARIDDLTSLLGCFVRPRDRGDLDGYRSGLAFRADLAPAVPSPSAAIAATVLVNLYLTPGHRVSATVPEGNGAADGLMMSLWSQQWPGLRRNFRFTVRETLGDDDLAQEVDLRLGRSKSRNRATVVAGDGRPGPPSSRLDPDDLGTDEVARTEWGWLGMATNDLATRGPTLFRSFLKRYGADVATGRGAFAGLSSAFVALMTDDTDGSASAFGHAMRRWFGMPDDAARLKREILSGRLGFGVTRDGRTAGLLTWMYAVARDVPDAVPCFDAGQWHEAVGHGLSTSGNVELWRLARRVWEDRDGDWTGPVLDALASRTDASDAITQAGGDWSLYVALVGRNRHLIEDPRPWGHQELRSTLFEALEEEPTDLEGVLSVLLPIDDRDLAAEAFDRHGGAVTRRVVAALNEGRPLPDVWAEEALSRPDATLDVVTSLTRVSRSFLVRLLTRYGVRDGALGRISPPVWTRVVEDAFGELAHDGWVRLWAFAFVLGIRERARGCEGLLTSSFEGLSRAAKDGSLGDLWTDLDRELPCRWSYYDWDIYHRLRVAVCDAFLSDDLDVCSFLDLTQDRDMRAELVLVLDQRWGGRRMLRKIMRKCLSAEGRRFWTSDARLPHLGDD